MKPNEYKSVCYRTEQRDERVMLRNTASGEVGYSFGCTNEGETVQVRLTNGELDSWSRNECSETQ
jgi:hypothetical protein